MMELMVGEVIFRHPLVFYRSLRSSHENRKINLWRITQSFWATFSIIFLFLLLLNLASRKSLIFKFGWKLKNYKIISVFLYFSGSHKKIVTDKLFETMAIAKCNWKSFFFGWRIYSQSFGDFFLIFCLFYISFAVERFRVIRDEHHFFFYIVANLLAFIIECLVWKTVKYCISSQLDANHFYRSLFKD